jgi:hypothetical protein
MSAPFVQCKKKLKLSYGGDDCKTRNTNDAVAVYGGHCI